MLKIKPGVASSCSREQTHGEGVGCACMWMGGRACAWHLCVGMYTCACVYACVYCVTWNFFP